LSLTPEGEHRSQGETIAKLVGSLSRRRERKDFCAAPFPKARAQNGGNAPFTRPRRTRGRSGEDLQCRKRKLRRKGRIEGENERVTPKELKSVRFVLHALLPKGEVGL